MLNLFIQIIACFIILLGLIAFPLPIPVGALLITIGLSLLIISSPRLRCTIRGYRKKFPRFNRAITKTEFYLPDKIKQAIQQTDPS